MNCNYCGAPLNGDETHCPACGKPLAGDDAQTEEAVQGETDTGSSAEPDEMPPTPSAEEPEPARQEPGKKKDAPKTAVLVIGILAVLAVIAALVVLLVNGSKKSAAQDSATAETTAAETTAAVSSETDAETETAATPTVSYSSRSAEEYNDALLDQVIATCGDYTLTNRTLPFYYWREYYTFQNYYADYISYLLDTTAGLDTQMYDETTTWEQMFLDSAISTFETSAAACTAANAEGYTLPAEAQASLDSLEDTLASYAQQIGKETAEDYLQYIYGPYCTVDSYREFLGEYLLASSYLSSKLSAQEITDEALEGYYEENITNYESNGLEKDDTSMVNVRHILIEPATVDLAEGDEGYDEAVQAAKDDAKAKAEEIYAQWQAGDMTEDSFAALATANSEDSGSAADGGLYEDVYPGEMKEDFNTWCFADGRQPGDTGIVETDYGYHIVYFVGSTGESHWHSVVYSDYQNELYSQMCTDLIAAYPATSDLTNAAIYPCNVEMAASSGQ
ncbi:MAG: peptidylprolyl isomerase [Oscillospiraceae bacterium]|nr:peptidylprolyl isomerase [Oscillospiraceae bacterium]